MVYQELCFNCGMPMVNGICPECGYQYPFAFECPFYKGISCIKTKRLCRDPEKYISCKLWQQSV